MSRSIDEILNEIDQMDLYEYDYKIIDKLLASGNNKLFTKILEEVLDGNLYWSDFDEYLSNTEYPKMLEENLQNQEKLYKKLQLFIDFKKNIDSNYQYTNDNDLMYLKGNNINSEDDEFYDNEVIRFKENMLYRILTISPKDNEISLALKNILYNAIRNYEIYKEDQSSYVFEDGYVSPVGSEDKYDVLDYNSILLFLHDLIIPLNYENQQLDEFDKDYMLKNNLNEEQMKQFKSLSMILKRDMINLPTAEELPGGE